MKRVIFLDVDEVLHSVSSHMALKGCPNPFRNYDLFNPISVALMQRLVKETDAYVVLSSTWRLWWEDGIAQSLGDHLGFTIHERTRGTEGEEPRGQQIADWLFENSDSVESYCIIDDSSDMLSWQSCSFVHCSQDYGFMAPEYRRAKLILENRSWQSDRECVTTHP